MISYFKFTNGEAFTLNDNDYTGYFHIVDGIPYTEKTANEDSVELTPKNTFMSKFYLNLGTFNTVYTNIQQLKPYYANVFDILNKQGLDSALKSLDEGNVTCFKGNVLGNPVVYKFEENDGFFYGLTASDFSITGITSPTAVEPFSENPSWTFLDEIKTATFTVNTVEDFKYFCSNGTELYVLSGNFGTPIPISIISSETIYSYNVDDLDTNDYIYNIYHDVDAKQLFVTKTNTVDIYDISNFAECNTLLLLDRIQLSATHTDNYIWNLTDINWDSVDVVWETKFSIQNNNNPHFIKFGGNIRTNLNGTNLTISNKHSSEVFRVIDLSEFGITEVLSLDIRNTDDSILLLYKSSDTIRVLHIDSSVGEILSDDKLESIRVMDGYRTETSPAYINIPNYTIKFSDIDSDLFYVYNTNEYQTRFISGPTYPAGRLELNDLFYLPNYTWDIATVIWNIFQVKWNYAKQTSNNFNNLVSTEIVNNNKMYMLHHNIGRLYAMNQGPDDRFFNSVPLNIPTKFNGTACTESTFGLYFNNAISNIVKDTVNLALKSFGKFEIHERSVIIKQLTDLRELTNDLYQNGNETFNVLSLQRIFVIINDMQSSLIPISIEN